MPYIVQTASASMPASCKGRYRRVAVLEIEPGAEPKMISSRARGVRQVVATWERLHHGKGVRDAYSRALEEANDMADRMNAEESE